jgi:hypothetical protein
MYILIFLTYYSFVFFVETLIYQRSFQKLCQNPGFQGYLKKLRRAEGGAKIVGVFRVKNHDCVISNGGLHWVRLKFLVANTDGYFKSTSSHLFPRKNNRYTYGRMQISLNKTTLISHVKCAYWRHLNGASFKYKCNTICCTLIFQPVCV